MESSCNGNGLWHDEYLHAEFYLHVNQYLVQRSLLARDLLEAIKISLPTHRFPK